MSNERRQPRAELKRMMIEAGLDILREHGLHALPEAVTYAAEDCSSSFFALSQLQRQPSLQRVYKGASGELKMVAATPSDDRWHAGLNLEALSRCLKEAAQETEQLQEGRDTAKFSKSLREAAKSIKALAKEQK